MKENGIIYGHMNHSWQIAGHKKQRDFLSKSIDSGSLPHGMIFAGPEHVGKLALAKNFARILLCENSSACESCIHCKSFSSQANPDYIELSFPETIKIEQVRNLAYQLNLKPYAAKFKVAVIDNAQDMTLEAANALLKLLEEPKPYTIIILVTSNPYSLLATIASRAQKISFGLVANNDFEHLVDQRTELEEKQLVLSLAAGRPGLAFGLSRNPETLLKIRDFARQYGEFMQADLAQRLILAQSLADYEAPELKEALQFWLLNLESELKQNPKPEVAKKISAVLKTRKLLDANVNSKLLLANMMINS
jgi:DNA polymerase III delta' subunit